MNRAVEVEPVRFQKREVPFLPEYYVAALTHGGGDADELRTLMAAYQWAEEQSRRHFGVTGNFSLVMNGPGLRRRGWPHVHVVFARSRIEKRVRLAAFVIKGVWSVFRQR